MFVRNPSSIKRKTIAVDEDMYIYLAKNGIQPISILNGKYIFILNNKIQKLLNTFKGGDI